MASLTVKQIEIALRKTGGMISTTAKKLNCSQGNISSRIKKSKYLQEVLEETTTAHLDLAESNLIKLIKDKNLGAICFYLKCKAKKRGYIESIHVEQEVKHVEPLVIKGLEGIKID